MTKEKWMIPKAPERVSVCYHCGNKTLMKLISTYGEGVYKPIKITLKDGSVLDTILNIQRQWDLFQCPICDEPTLFYRHWDNKLWLTEKKRKSYVETVLYPPINIENNGVPDKIKKRFETTFKLKNIDPEQCVVAIRMTMELICKDKNAEGKNLYEKITNLCERGVLPEELGKLGHMLRLLGNKAVHVDDDVDFSESIIEKALDCLSAILDYVYIIPKRIVELDQEVKRLKGEQNNE